MECFPASYPTGSAKDDFDDRSTHVIVRVDEHLAAYGRLTPGPGAYFENVTRKLAIIPTGPNVVDFGRVMVAPARRGHDLFELILIEGMILAADMGFPAVVGSLRPDRRFRPFIHDLGFADSGPALPFYFPNGVVDTHQPVVAHTNGKRDSWITRKVASFQRLRDKGYDILDNGCAVMV
jgi:predicted GNAT family N-acyltransferase